MPLNAAIMIIARLSEQHYLQRRKIGEGVENNVEVCGLALMHSDDSKKRDANLGKTQQENRS